jgi:dTDP-4-amino-4,6-dideoxygalactose transaminase
MPDKLALLGGKPVRKTPFSIWPVFDAAEEQALLASLRSAMWGRLDGNEVERFEQRFAACHGTQHAVAVCNGTVALRIALLAGGIKAGDEVIVPSYTFVATASAVVECNATPIMVDVDLETFCLDPAAVEAALSVRTKAIIPVHFAGQPAAMHALNAIAKKKGLLVIEDAAQAPCAQYDGQSVGTLGHMATFSFQSSKNLTCGEGGIIITNNPDLARACVSVHNCGRLEDKAWYEHYVTGGNYRLTEFQGALLNAQMDRLAEQAQRREENGTYLSQRLAQVPGIAPQKRDDLCTRHAYHLLPYRIDTAEFGISRDEFLAALVAEGVPSVFGYLYPLHRQPVFVNKAFGPYDGVSKHIDYAAAPCPNADMLCTAQAAWLEQRFFLGTKQDMDDIFNAFEKVYENRAALRSCEA